MTHRASISAGASLADTATAAVDDGPGTAVFPQRLPEGIKAVGDPLSPAGPAATPSPRRVRQVRRLVKTVALMDLVMIAAGLAAAFVVGRRVNLGWPMPGLETFDVAPVLLVLWMLALMFVGAYDTRTFGAGPTEFVRVLKAAIASAVLAATVSYFTPLHVSRVFLVWHGVFGVVCLLGERLAVRRWVYHRRVAGTLSHRVLAVGSHRCVNELADALRRSRMLGYEIVGRTLTDPASSGMGAPDDLHAPVVGSVADIVATCSALDTDMVMVAGDSDVELRSLAWELEGHDVDLVVVPRLADVAAPRMQVHAVEGIPLLFVEEPQAARAGHWPKRAFDLLGGTAALLLLSPVMLVVAVLIKLADRGPVLYRQQRVGRHGEPFWCLKFRSMGLDAEAREAELRANLGHAGALFKMEKDPRVTRVGRFIRRYSIDELPQLFNVLGGSMSLVGPRPQQQWEVDTYNEVARRRLHVRPGMTGLWQVSGRSQLPWNEALRLDLYYRDNWSITTDLMIMARTLKAVFGRSGAY